MPTLYAFSYVITPVREIFRDDMKMWSVFYVREGRMCAVPSISIAVEVGMRGLSVVVEVPCAQVCTRVASVYRCGLGGCGSEVWLRAKVLRGCESVCEVSAEDGAGGIEHKHNHFRRCRAPIAGVTAARP